MRFPEKYIKHGKFKLHSGQLSDTFYDVNAMLTDKIELNKILDEFPWQADTCVGIATGGAIIASHMSKYSMNFAMIKDGELKGKIEGEYCLVDDVVTTEESLRQALKIIGIKPKYIFVVLDRRPKSLRSKLRGRNKDLIIHSLYNMV